MITEASDLGVWETGSERAVRLFYFQGRNFGDSLSLDVVKHLSAGKVIYSPAHSADISGIGSIVKMIRKDLIANPRQCPRKLALWGSGCMEPETGVDASQVEVFAVRGAITASLLGVSSKTPMGDPGLFADELLEHRPPQTDKIGIVPHHKLLDDPELQTLLSAEPRLHLIDPRNRRAKAVIREIATCSHILSSSLHGLVVADSLGIPNTWLNPKGNHWFPELKFLDYASALGRPMTRPVDLSDVRSDLSEIMSVRPYWQERVTEVKGDLRESFERVAQYICSGA